jgi:hypothetical protein
MILVLSSVCFNAGKVVNAGHNINLINKKRHPEGRLSIVSRYDSLLFIATSSTFCFAFGSSSASFLFSFTATGFCFRFFHHTAAPLASAFLASFLFFS